MINEEREEILLFDEEEAELEKSLQEAQMNAMKAGTQNNGDQLFEKDGEDSGDVIELESDFEEDDENVMPCSEYEHSLANMQSGSDEDSVIFLGSDEEESDTLSLAAVEKGLESSKRDKASTKKEKKNASDKTKERSKNTKRTETSEANGEGGLVISLEPLKDSSEESSVISLESLEDSYVVSQDEAFDSTQADAMEHSDDNSDDDGWWFFANLLC